MFQQRRRSPLFTDINTRTTATTTTRRDAAMDDVQDLSSLENDDADEFDRLLIQNARDERRLKEALNGTRRVTAFSKARSAKLTNFNLDSLERNHVRNDGAIEASGHVTVKSPPSSSGSARSDPAIRAPPTWGRKSRSNRNWMRTITYEEQVQKPPPVTETANGLYDDQYQQHEGADDADLPRHSVEDSPLSHKSTPRHDRSAEWDLTFELNEASIIASTPYIPRNTALDDIRQRELESLKLDRIRETSPEPIRRPRLSSATNVANNAEPAVQAPASPEKRIRNRAASWQSIGKSQPVTGTGKENSPVTIYQTSTETVSVVERNVDAGTQKRPARPSRHRREDSQDLLRRLARASNTPSPGRVAASRPQTAPARQPDSSFQIKQTATPPLSPGKDESVEDEHIPQSNTEPEEAAPDMQPPQEEPEDAPQEPEAPLEEEVAEEREAEDVDATPMPVERTILNPKTPVVTGAWVETPGPRTIRKHITIARSPSQSPKKGSPQEQTSAQENDTRTANEVLEEVVVDTVRPQVPSSALQALVQEARAHGRRESADYGDSTINSLEDLIASPVEEVEEDTLQGLQVPTTIPRNEAERQRQQELLHLHRMNDRLRAARTSIRDASRGMKRVEDRVEHGEEVDGTGRTVVRECPCAVEAGHRIPLWKYPVIVFWDSRLKTKREGSRWRMCGGLTPWSILLLTLLLWWISEEIACELYCQHPYATYSRYQYSVNPDAPQYPFVLPTLFYRNFIRVWWEPSSHVTRWIWRNAVGDVSPTILQQSASSTATWASTERVVEEVVWDQSMLSDEVIR
ncbi:hypothetical protein CC86DRAFT_368813 [Ophiobolus disseminans]|uniref:Uncharacterized protein n=1 Tax=Ophiobolus disseminans TaxID=1469910 RepID=A0A6A7A5Q4_9PLEO|nr:hypothetical protein CC86DRAFT_368813 [Ophiobolus disseminans]